MSIELVNVSCNNYFCFQILNIINILIFLLNFFDFYTRYYISFKLYPAHSRVSRGNLVLRQSFPHFLPKSGGIAWSVAELNAALYSTPERRNGNINYYIFILICNIIYLYSFYLYFFRSAITHNLPPNYTDKPQIVDSRGCSNGRPIITSRMTTVYTALHAKDPAVVSYVVFKRREKAKLLNKILR